MLPFCFLYGEDLIFLQPPLLGRTFSMRTRLFRDGRWIESLVFFVGNLEYIMLPMSYL